MKIITQFQVLFFLMLFSVNSSVLAEELYMFTEEVPSADEMAAIMFPDIAGNLAPKVKTRAIQFGTKKKQETPEPISIGMPVNFAYASYELQPESKPFLDQVGVMMNLEKLSDAQLIIEGHTDSSGPELYNADLSKKRANAVKLYLMDHYNIAAKRLIVIGKGEANILDGKSPNDPMNRRVEFKPGR